MPTNSRNPLGRSRTPLQRISHHTLQEQVYRNIRHSLMEGQFRPGEILTIRELARQLGTSVMPVREALHKLTVEKVLDVTASRSVCVPLLSAEQFAEICEVRMLLEGKIARLAAERATPADIAKIEGATHELAAAKAAGDPAQLLRRGREFTFSIFAAARHGTLMSLIEPIWVRCGPCTLAMLEFMGADQIRQAAFSFRRVLDALRAQLPLQVEEALLSDIQLVNERYRAHAGNFLHPGTKARTARSAAE